MKLFMLMRAAAQLIDLIVGMLLFAGAFIVVSPFALSLTHNETPAAVITLVSAIAAIFLLQIPFMQNNQTIGKAFCGMSIISTDNSVRVTVGLILHRELVLKLMTCYLICIPMMTGGQGGHETATHTTVVKRPRKTASKRAAT